MASKSFLQLIIVILCNISLISILLPWMSKHDINNSTTLDTAIPIIPIPKLITQAKPTTPTATPTNILNSVRDICIICHDRMKHYNKNRNKAKFNYKFSGKTWKMPTSSNLQYERCNFFASTNHPEIVTKTNLIIDGEMSSSDGCPIKKTDELYPYIKNIVESNLDIFKQISYFDRLNISNKAAPKWNELTRELQDEYLMHGNIHFVDWYFNEIQNEGHLQLEWTEQYINEYMIRVANGNYSGGSYASRFSERLFNTITCEKYKSFIINASALVIGSQRPWLEVVLLVANIGHVTTSEYANITMTHPRQSYIHPYTLNENIGNKYFSKYDVIFSFSSIEHSGLGRYGDPLNPSGDIMVAAQLSCLLKPGGLLFLGVPTSLDAIGFNAGRIYGPKRLRLLLMQFKLIDVGTDYVLKMNDNNHPIWYTHPWLVLQNKRGCL